VLLGVQAALAGQALRTLGKPALGAAIVGDRSFEDECYYLR
jgi:hypothetical protein